MTLIPGQRSLNVMENGTIRYTMYGFLLLFNSNLSVSQGQKKFFEIFDIKDAVILKTGIRVREGH